MLRHAFVRHAVLSGMASGLLASPDALIAQTVPVTRLDRPTATFETPFSNLTGLRELPDGRLLVADRTETTVWAIDLSSGAARQIGRQGAGPGEYTWPFGLYPGRGNSTILLDLSGRRLLTIGPDARFLDEIVRAPMIRNGFKPPRGIDTLGRVYLDLMDILTPRTEEAAARCVAPVLRWTPGANRVDSITALNFPPVRPGADGGSGGPVPPYQPRDAWAVDPTGRVAIVRYAPYRVEWFLPGQDRPVTGPIVAAEPVRIGRAEQEVWLDQLVANSGFTISRDGQGQSFRPQRPNPNDLDWPATMPLFDGPAWIGRQGEVWVKRNQPASAERVRYDLFDDRGRLIRQVELPRGRRLVGLGEGTVYAIRQDEDGLQWLERYAFRLPP